MPRRSLATSARRRARAPGRVSARARDPGMRADKARYVSEMFDDVAAGANGSNVVAKLVPAGGAAAQRIERTGEPCGTRTRDSLLKRQVLYRLS